MTAHIIFAAVGQLIVMTCWFLQACLANGMALRRTRSTRLWTWLAVIFGPFALLTLKLLPAKVARA